MSELTGFGCVLLLAIIYHWQLLAAPELLPDEQDYFQAFSLIQQSRSPFEASGYIYLPFFARIGAFGEDLFGQRAVATSVRFLNILGAATLLWVSLALVMRSGLFRIILSALLLALLPPLRSSIREGNLSAGITGFTVAAFLLWTRRPVCAGMLLGLAFSIKPLGLGVFPVLFCQRSLKVRQAMLTCLIAITVFLITLLMCVFDLDDFFKKIHSFAYQKGSISLLMAFQDFGVPVPQAAIAALILGATAYLVRTQKNFSLIDLLCLACVSSLSASPLVWSHTLSLGIPAAILSIQKSLLLLRSEWKASRIERERAILTFLVVWLAFIAFLGGYNWKISGHFPRWIEGLLTSIPIMSVWVLTWYSVNRHDKWVLSSG